MKLFKVAQVSQTGERLAMIVDRDTLLKTAIRHFADTPHVGGIFVVAEADSLIDGLDMMFQHRLVNSAAVDKNGRIVTNGAFAQHRRLASINRERIKPQ